MFDTKEIDNEIKAEKCRRSLYEYTKEFWEVAEPGVQFIDSRCIKAISDHLQAVTAGIFDHLVICIPPGFAKSISSAVMWPTWTWLEMPYIRSLFGSYDEKLTIRDADKCRDIIRSDKYINMFKLPWRIKHNSNSKNYIENSMTGSRKTYYMTSRKKTGWRGNFVVVDDPLSAEDRYDRLIKAQVVETWDKVLPSRVNRNQIHGFVVIMQRLADDDLVGHIKRTLGDRYTFLILPNEFDPNNRCRTYYPDGRLFFEDWRTEEGELLCPELFSAKDTEETKAKLGQIDYQAQYQHNPTPLEGMRFSRELFQYWRRGNNPYIIELMNRNGEVTDTIRIDLCMKFIAADFASSEEHKKRNDCTSLGLLACTSRYQLILLHRMKFRKGEPGILEELKALYRMPGFGQHLPSWIAAEDNGLGLPIAQAAQAEGLPVVFVNVHKDKMVMSATALVRVAGGQVYFPQFDDAPWMHDFADELIKFPSTGHDDDVSMISIASNSFYEPPEVSPIVQAVSIPHPTRFNASRIQPSGDLSRFGVR
jgi:predicted phage terminase large subunit-like protein